jgi:two-component system NarL family sensor kinase
MVSISKPRLVPDKPGPLNKVGEFNTGNKTMGSEDKNENDLIASKQKIAHGKLHGKQSLKELQHPLSEADIETALQSLAHRVQETHGIHVECIGDGVLKSLPKDTHILLFRIILELLMNVVRHANARHASISICREESQIRINVMDDGIGFNTADLARTPEKDTGFGLFSMRKRAVRLGGRLDLISHPGRGTRAVLVIPE